MISAFVCGEERAFRWMYNQYAPAMRLFAAKYLGERTDVDDVVQEAFITLWEKRTRFADENGIKAFLYQTIRNACLNILRHGKVKEKYAEHFTPEEEGESFLDHLLEAEMFRMVVAVFDQLTPAARKVYHLSLEGKTHEEISSLLNITINTVKKHKNNANHFMRERLKNLLTLLMTVL